MSTFREHRCVHCGRRYSYQTSGYGGIQEFNDGSYCSSCYKFILEALKSVPEVTKRDWVGTSDVSVETLVEQERQVQEAAKAEGRIPVRRVLPPLFDLERPDNQHMQGIVLREGRTYRYEYWTQQGGMAAGRVYLEVERDAQTGEVLGPWSLTDRWTTPPTIIEHPPWPDAPPPTHEFKPGVPLTAIPLRTMRCIIENQSLADIKFPRRPGQINYGEIGRSLFVVEPLPQGALPIYDKDPDVTSLITGDDEDPKE